MVSDLRAGLRPAGGFLRPWNRQESMSVQRDLEVERVGHLDLLPFLAVPIGTRVSEVLARMREERQNCALITDGDGRLVGIFTERDVLHKVATKPESLT